MKSDQAKLANRIILMAAQSLSLCFWRTTAKFSQQIPIGSEVRGLICNVFPLKEMSFFAAKAASLPLSVLKTTKAFGEHTKLFARVSPEVASAVAGAGVVSSIPKTCVNINRSIGRNHLGRDAPSTGALAEVAEVAAGSAVSGEPGSLSSARTSDSRSSVIFSACGAKSHPTETPTIS